MAAALNDNSKKMAVKMRIVRGNNKTQKGSEKYSLHFFNVTAAVITAFISPVLVTFNIDLIIEPSAHLWN